LGRGERGQALPKLGEGREGSGGLGDSCPAAFVQDTGDPVLVFQSNEVMGEKSMLSRILKAVAIAAAVVFAAVSAEETATLKGTVFSSKTSTGARMATLTATEGSYTIIMDDRGEKLAKDMNGQKPPLPIPSPSLGRGAEVIGVVTKEGDSNLLRVLSYSPILTGAAPPHPSPSLGRGGEGRGGTRAGPSLPCG